MESKAFTEKLKLVWMEAHNGGPYSEVPLLTWNGKKVVTQTCTTV